MKKLVLLTAFMMSIGIMNAQQLKPKVSISWSTIDHFRLENISGNRITYNMPTVMVHTGLEYQYKFISAFYDDKFWCKSFQHGAFTPEEVHFSIGVSANITKNVKVTISHTCWHPINSSGKKHVSLYGGNETVTLSYGY